MEELGKKRKRLRQVIEKGKALCVIFGVILLVVLWSLCQIVTVIFGGGTVVDCSSVYCLAVSRSLLLTSFSSYFRLSLH